MKFHFQRRIWQATSRPIVVGLSAIFISCAVTRSAPDSLPDYEVKAAFLYHFAEFMEWSPAAFTNDNAPLVIGIFGENPFHGFLEALVAAQKSKGRAMIENHPIEVRSIKELPDLRSCQILFIAPSARPEEAEILKTVKGLPILTVSDADDFCSSGGMIQFFIQDNKVHFNINNDAAKAAGLKISSKLLILAAPGQK